MLKNLPQVTHPGPGNARRGPRWLGSGCVGQKQPRRPVRALVGEDRDEVTTHAMETSTVWTEFPERIKVSYIPTAQDGHHQDMWLLNT